MEEQKKEFRLSAGKYTEYVKNAVGTASSTMVYLLGEVYYLAWTDDFMRFWCSLTEKTGTYLTIASRVSCLKGCSRESAEKIVDICRKNIRGERAEFSSADAFLEALEKETRFLSGALDELDNENYKKCLELRYENFSEEEKRQCVKTLDLAACFKINTVSSLKEETWEKLSKMFPSMCGQYEWERLNKEALGRRNTLEGHVSPNRTEALTPESWQELREPWERIAGMLINENTEGYYGRMQNALKRGDETLRFVLVPWRELTKETGLSEDKCKAILCEKYNFDSEMAGVICASAEQANWTLSGSISQEKENSEELKELKEKRPDLSESEIQNNKNRYLIEEGLKNLPELDALANYHGGALDRRQIRELLRTHQVVLDASMFMDAQGRDFISGELLPEAVKLVKNGQKQPFIVEAQTRWRLLEEHKKNGKPYYFFMEDVLNKINHVLRYYGVPDPQKTREEALVDFVDAHYLKRICILVRGASRLPKMLDHEKYPFCVVGRVQQLPGNNTGRMMIFPEFLPLSGGREDHLDQKLLQMRPAEQESRVRTEETLKSEKVKKPERKETVSKPLPAVWQEEFIVAPGRIDAGMILCTEKGGQVRLVRKLSVNGQDAEGGEGALYETDRKGVVAKIYHENRRTEERWRKLTDMTAHPVKIKKVCWPTEVLYNEEHGFVGYLMPQVPGEYLPLETSVLQLNKSEVQKTILPGWTRRSLAEAAAAVAEALEKLHEKDILMGDINAGNFLVNPLDSRDIYLVDCDSYQIGNKYPCPVGKEEYTHPAMGDRLGTGGKLEFGTFFRTKDEEQYSLAVLLFQILMLGQFPFTSKGGKGLVQAMKDREFPYVPKNGKNAPEGPSWMIWKNFPRRVANGFSDTFQNWKTLPAGEWKQIMKNYKWSIENRGYSDKLTPKKYHEFNPDNPQYVDVVCIICKEEFNVHKDARVNRKAYRCRKCEGFLRDLDKREDEEYTCSVCRKKYMGKASEGYLSETTSQKLICPACRVLRGQKRKQQPQRNNNRRM